MNIRASLLFKIILTAAVVILAVSCTGKAVENTAAPDADPTLSTAETDNAESDVSEPEIIEAEPVSDTAPDEKAPDFEYALLDGGSGRLSDLIGKPVFINFWASWCGPCVMEMPDIQNIYDSYGDEIHVLTINIGETHDTARGFMEEEGYSFPVALDEDISIATMYNVQTIPQTFVLDENGQISAHISYSADEKTFAAALDSILEGE